MEKSNTCTHETPIPSRFPWLVYFHGHHFDTQTFYDIEGGNYYIKQIPDMSNKCLCANSHGWMVMTDFDLTSDEQILLLNPVSMEKIVLLPFKPKPTFKFSWSRCILSLPPSDPKCIVAFFDTNPPYIVFCHPSDKVWREEELDINNRFIDNVFSCDGKICYNNGGSLMELKVLDNDKLEVTKLVEIEPKKVFDGSVIEQWFFVESLGDIFLVIIGVYSFESKNRIRNVCVFKMNLRDLEWESVNNLGDDRVFFLSQEICMSCSSIGSSSSVRKNSIYFTSLDPEEVGMMSMHVYDVEEKTIATYLVCPNVYQNVSSGQWIMPFF